MLCCSNSEIIYFCLLAAWIGLIVHYLFKMTDEKEQGIKLKLENDFKENADKKPKENILTRESIPLSSDLGFKRFCVVPSVLDNIFQHSLQDGNGVKGIDSNNGASVQVLGVLFGKKEGENIQVVQSFTLDANLDASQIVTDRNFYTKMELELLGFYSNGNIPNDKDVEIFEAVLKKSKVSLFLLKFNPTRESVKIETVFESILASKFLDFIQLHTNPDCEGLINNESKNTSETSKVFYIKFKTPRLGCYELHKKGLPEALRSKLDKLGFPGVKPNFFEYKETIYEIAENEGIKSKIDDISDCFESNIKRYDLLELLQKIAEKARLEIAFNFRILLSKPKDVSCEATVLDYGWCSCNDVSSVEDSKWSTVYATLLGLSIYQEKELPEVMP